MAELPSGTVTFLFTDIEGSTQLLRTLRERYADVLADHERLLRSAFGDAGGHEIDTQGDSFFYAFRKPKDAVLAAVAAQRALQSHPWPDGAEVRVRIGIHTGEATLTENRYHGLAVHRAARICAAGHGGQILLSQISQSLLEDEEAELPGLTLRDLGSQRLKDFDRPVGIFQLVAADLRTDFPPLRTLDTAPEAQEPAAVGDGRLSLLIVDDQALVRAGFRMILDAEDDIDVVGEATNGAEAIEEVRRLRPDIVLMDVRMPRRTGIEACTAIKDVVPSAKIIMLTISDEEADLYEAIKAGATGYLLKEISIEEVASAIREVAGGKSLISPSMASKLLNEFASMIKKNDERQQVPAPRLTDRELEVLKLVAKGLNNRDIAKELYISENTVKNHIRNILEKLQLHSRMEAVVYAVREKLLEIT
jgi:DNA-binding NarL/FixJ family response regulator/class 3 adenylate cyclase